MKIIIFVLVIIAFGCLSRLPVFIGFVGELIIKIKIGKNIDGQQYSIHNYQVAVENKSMQVDHIVINKYGIHVIETKNFSGRIYGAENQLKWTQILAYGKVKNQFYNPIKQNETHLINIKKIVSDNDVPCSNIVVFVKNNTYKINSSHIVKLGAVKRVINTPISKTELTSSQITNIYNVLNTYQSSNKISKAEHIDNIYDTQNKIENNICPRCGSELVEKSGKYGKFWACSNYPNCKFTKKN